MIAIAAATVLALAGCSSTWQGAKQDTKANVVKTKDVAVEGKQAVKDAVTPGDQSTTRPNANGSTRNLDQKAK